MATRQETANAVYRDYIIDGVASTGPHSPVKSEIRAYEAMTNAAIDALIDGQSVGALAFETWALLAAVTGSAAGAPAEVFGDLGTHTDPVVGGTVSNSGKFRWLASPAGWKRIDDNALSLKAPLASPNFTGVPLAPTPILGDYSTRIANTTFVVDTIANGFRSSYSGGNNWLGDHAGQALASGSGNLFAGYYAGAYANNISSCTFLGANSGLTLTGGAGGNIFLGALAGQGIVDGAYNTILGPALGLPSNLTGAILLATGDNSICADYNYTFASKWTFAGGINPASLPIGTTTALGAFKVGTGLGTGIDGTLNVTGSVGAGGAPGGGAGVIQFNNGGSIFGGAAGFIWSPTLRNLSLTALSGGGANAGKSIASTIIAGDAAYDVGLRISRGGNAYSGLDIEVDATAGGHGQAMRIWTNIGGTWAVPTYFGAEGGLYTRVGVLISGHFLPTTPVPGQAQQIQYPSNDAMMFGIVADVFGPAMQVKGVYPSNYGAGGYLFSGLSGDGTYSFSIENDGTLGWGAGNRAAMDTWLSRESAATLCLGKPSNTAPVAQTLTAQGVVGGTLHGAFSQVDTAAPAGATVIKLSGQTMPAGFGPGMTVTCPTSPGSVQAGTTVVSHDFLTYQLVLSLPLVGAGLQGAGMDQLAFSMPDTAAPDLTIEAPRGTGTGAGGSLRFKVAPAGAAGVNQNALVEAFRVDGTLNRTVLKNGAANAPSISFESLGGNRGLFCYTTDSIAYTNGGTELASWGSIGFTTTSLSFGYAFNSGSELSNVPDLLLARQSASVLEVVANFAPSINGFDMATIVARNLDLGAVYATRLPQHGGGAGVLSMRKATTSPTAGPTNGVIIYAEDNGAGKTRLMARFPSGAAQQIAIEP